MLSGGQVAMTSKKRSRTQAAKKEANQNTEPIKVSVYQSFLASRVAFATLIVGVIVLRLVLFYTSLTVIRTCNSESVMRHITMSGRSEF